MKRSFISPLGLCLLVLLFTSVQVHGQLLLIGAKEKGKKYGYINERGDYVIAPLFDAAGYFNKGAAVVKQGKKFGVINEQGQFTVQPMYDDAQFYAPDGKFTVKKENKWGVITTTGEIIIPFGYDYLSVMKDGYIVAGKFIPGKAYKGRVCPTVLNDKNEVVYSVGENDPEGHDCTQLFLPGFVNAKYGGYSYGWPIVRDGYLVLREAWEGGPTYSTLRLINVSTGQGPALPNEVQMADAYHGLREGILAVSRTPAQDWVESDYDSDLENGEATSGVPEKLAKQWGEYYDTAVIRTEDFSVPTFSADNPKEPLTFHGTHPYFNRVAAVEKKGKWVFIDREGWVINETHLSTTEYKATPPMYFNGLIGMFKNGKAGYVDITGREIIPFDLDEYHPFEYAVTPVKKNGLYGLLRKDGSWAIAPKFVDLFISPCPCYQ